MILFRICSFMQVMQISWALLGLASPRYFAWENVKQRSNSLLAPYFPCCVKLLWCKSRIRLSTLLRWYIFGHWKMICMTRMWIVASSIRKGQFSFVWYFMMIIYVHTVYLSIDRCIHSKPAHVKIYIHIAGNFNCGMEECWSAIATDPFLYCLLTFLVMCCWVALVEIVITPAKDNREEKK
jgi:hypothetical protein